MKLSFFAIMVLLIIVVFSACNEPEDNNPVIETTVPEIDSITASTHEIRIGWEFPEKAILTAYARGGDLTYIWEVDLGDIIPKSTDGSVVEFTAAACCIGKKEISCKVSNDKGSDTKVIIINLTK